MAIAGSATAGQKYIEQRRGTRQRASIIRNEYGQKTGRKLGSEALVDSKDVRKVMADETADVKNKRLISDRVTSNNIVIDEASFIVSPNDPNMKTWDLVIAILLIYTALFTPWEISFLEPDLNALFFLNLGVDLIFLIDLFLQFFLAYYDDDSRQWITDHSKIFYNYFTTWFFVDLVSILPFSPISIGMKRGWFVTTTVVGPELAAQLNVLRLIRLFRLVKLVRIFRASRIFARWESKIGVSWSTISLTKFLLGIIFISHLFACLLHIVPSYDTSSTASWITDYDMHNADSLTKYLAALYWSVMTVTTIGFGDITPATSMERAFLILVMLVGGAMYAYIVGAICGIVASMDEATIAYHQTVDHLNNYMEETGLPENVRVKMREYFAHCRVMLRHQYYHDVLINLSPGLRAEFALFLHADWVSKVWFFNTYDQQEQGPFITALATSVVARVFPPRETIIYEGEETENMFIIQRGLIARLGRILGGGKFVGEDIILDSSRRHYSAVSVTYVDCYILSKGSLRKILDTGKFPILKKQIRKAAIKLAFMREVIKYAALYKFAKLHGYRVTSQQCMDAVRALRGQGMTSHEEVLRGMVATSKEKITRFERQEQEALTPQQRMINAMKGSGYLDYDSKEEEVKVHVAGPQIVLEDVIEEEEEDGGAEEEGGEVGEKEVPQKKTKTKKTKKMKKKKMEKNLGGTNSRKVVPMASVLPVEKKTQEEMGDQLSPLPNFNKRSKGPGKALTSTILSRPSRARGFADDRVMDQLHKQEAMLSAQLHAMEKRLAQTEKTLSDNNRFNSQVQVLLLLVILVSVFLRPFV